MRIIRSIVLYAGLALGANAAMADFAAVEALRDGDMQKLNFHSESKPTPDTVFFDADGNETTLAAFEGKHVVLNFWATWCAPCRAEMPSLDRLEAELGSDAFAVIPVATGRNPRPAIDGFFADAEIEHLPVFTGPKQQLARKMAVLGLPVTVVIDAEGNEIARLTGDAEWDSESAKDIVTALVETP